ncbi:glutathione S-transferase family protein [Nitrospirillum viridazoti]|uniref:Glutathione S-transferase n=1 Tax=Nitrospirillum amazonense TaxID=28077 RepID=A0A560IU44_9PROT|nr:glutathione S-transferase family protein [Nitrospirillum amazonense]TWB60514.1 glutathione S-transferase [Nitrospirillum amazonense]
MELYTLPGSPSARKVLAVIHHLGLTVEVHTLDFMKQETRQPGFLALNPNGMVPVLVDGSLTLWESCAINQYLVAKAGGSSLFPDDPAVRADITRWQFWEQAHFNKAWGTLIFESIIKPRNGLGEPAAEVMAFFQKDLARFAPVLEAHLAGRTYLVGDGVTLADYGLVCLEGYRSVTPFDWAPFPNINRYLDHMREQPAWVKAAPPVVTVAA